MKKLPKKSVIWRWVISYTCIILISAVSSLVIYDRSRDFIKERQEKINEVLLEQATRQIQDCVVMMEKLREEILINSVTIPLINPVLIATYQQPTSIICCTGI